MQSFLSPNLILQRLVNRNFETYADSEKIFLSGLAKRKYQLEQLTSDVIRSLLHLCPLKLRFRCITHSVSEHNHNLCCR